jgi:hypothetical protein
MRNIGLKNRLVNFRLHRVTGKTGRAGRTPASLAAFAAKLAAFPGELTNRSRCSDARQMVMGDRGQTPVQSEQPALPEAPADVSLGRTSRHGDGACQSRDLPVVCGPTGRQPRLPTVKQRPAPLNHHLLLVRSCLWLGNRISYPPIDCATSFRGPEDPA